MHLSFGVTARMGKHSRGKWILSCLRQLAKKKRFCKDRKFSLHFYNMPRGFVLHISNSAVGKGPVENTGFPFHLCSAFWAVRFRKAILVRVFSVRTMLYAKLVPGTKFYRCQLLFTFHQMRYLKASHLCPLELV